MSERLYHLQALEGLLSHALKTTQAQLKAVEVAEQKGEIARTVHYLNVKVGGYDAEFWRDNYVALRDAMDEHLEQFLFDTDEGEAAIYVDGIRRVGQMLHGVSRDRETGRYVGKVHLNNPEDDQPDAAG